jgi:hypothetical protein
MSVTRLEDDSVLLAAAEFHDAFGERERPWRIRLRNWWRNETVRVVEDEAFEQAHLGGRPIRLILPLVLPVLAVAALVALFEPDNLVAVICLGFAALAITYGVLADLIERRVRGNWFPILNTAAYAVIIAPASSPSRRSWSATSSAELMAHPLSPSNISCHQPSRIDRLSPPLSAAFMPEVPHAS